MSTIAKVVTKYIPQQPIVTPVPDLVVSRVQLDISIEEAQIIRALAGHELEGLNRKNGFGSLIQVFNALCDAGVELNPLFNKRIPAPSAENKAGWEWKAVV